MTSVTSFSTAKCGLDAAMAKLAKAERGDGFTIPEWRIHDLRRTAATGMAGIGIAPHIVEAALNHVSGAKGGIAGIYNREQYAEERRVALARWAMHVESIINGARSEVVVPFVAK